MEIIRIMKKIKLLVVGLLLAISNNVFAQNSLYCDVNGDGEVNIADVNAVVSVILGQSQMDNIVGSWISEYGVDPYGRYDILERDVVTFEFHEDHTGVYYSYINSNLIYIDLTWAQTPQRLYIWYNDGFNEELYYGIDESGYLLLALDEQFTSYTAYRPNTESDLNRIDPNKDSHRVHRASVSRDLTGRTK